MQQVRVLNRPVGLVPGDHVAWAFDDPASLRSATADYLREGVDHCERLMFIASDPVRGLVGELSRTPGGLARGQLVVRPATDMLRRVAAGRPCRAADSLREEADAAVAAGFTGLRVWADVTDLTTSPFLAQRWLDYEIAVETVFDEKAATGLCALDTQRAGEHWNRVATVHRVQRRRDATPRFAARVQGNVVGLVGEVDVVSAGDLESLLDDARRCLTGPVTVDLADLGFIDVAGTRVLARFHRDVRAAGGAVRFRHARPVTARLLAAFGLHGDLRA